MREKEEIPSEDGISVIQVAIRIVEGEQGGEGYDVRFAQILCTHFHFVVTRGFGLSTARSQFGAPVSMTVHLHNK